MNKQQKTSIKKTHKSLMKRSAGKGGKKTTKRTPAELRDMFEHMK